MLTLAEMAFEVRQNQCRFSPAGDSNVTGGKGKRKGKRLMPINVEKSIAGIRERGL